MNRWWPACARQSRDPAKLRDAVQTVTLLALRAVGVMDARARGLVVQAIAGEGAGGGLSVVLVEGPAPPRCTFFVALPE